MDARTRLLVRQRAGDCCEYCRIAQAADAFFTLHIEHIIARQHGGGDEVENLALACFHCNLHKGPNLTAIDPITKEVVPLFNPRHQQWVAHFRPNADAIEGASAIGRATAALLKMNAADRRRLRITGGRR